MPIVCAGNHQERAEFGDVIELTLEPVEVAEAGEAEEVGEADGRRERQQRIEAKSASAGVKSAVKSTVKSTVKSFGQRPPRGVARKTKQQRLLDTSQSIRRALFEIEEFSKHVAQNAEESPMVFDVVHARVRRELQAEWQETPQETTPETTRHAGRTALDRTASVPSTRAAFVAASASVPRVVADAEPANSHIMIPLGDRVCDEFLGGGLVCGALHEICGVCAEPQCENTGREARDEARDKAYGETHEETHENNWIVPFGSIAHIVHQAATCDALGSRAIAWIGDRVQPEPSALRRSIDDARDGLDQQVLARSIYVRDVCETRRTSGFAKGAAKDAARETAKDVAKQAKDKNVPANSGGLLHRRPDIELCAPTNARSQGCSHERNHERNHERKHERNETSSHRVIAGATSPVQLRAWCAEQTLRTAAASIIVLDGSGFDFLAWRRLQLAAAACELPVLVLVICPPSSRAGDRTCVSQQGTRHNRASRHVQPRVHSTTRPAATQWSVCASAGVPVPPLDSALTSALTSALPSSLAFRWSMTLQAVRGKAVDAVQRASRAGTAAWMTEVADGRIVCNIERHRCEHAVDEWARITRAAAQKLCQAAEPFQGEELLHGEESLHGEELLHGEESLHGGVEQKLFTVQHGGIDLERCASARAGHGQTYTDAYVDADVDTDVDTYVDARDGATIHEPKAPLATERAA